MLKILDKSQKINFRTKFKEGLQPLDTGHNIHTPYELCLRILDKIKPNSNQTFGIFYTIEFAIILIEDFGLDPSNIWLFGDSPEKEKIANHLGINYNKIHSRKNKMIKFDVIVGNPPYDRADEGSSAKLWTQIFENSIDLLNTNGFIGMASPTSWFYRPDNQKFKNLTKKMQDGDLIFADLNVKDEFFKNIGESIGYVIWSSKKYSGSTTFKKDAAIQKVKWDGKPIGFTNEEKIKFKIIDKLENNRFERFRGYNDYGNSTNTKDLLANNVISKTKSLTHNNEIWWSGSQRMYGMKKDIKPGWKIIFNRSGHYYDKDDKEKYIMISDSLGVGQLAIAVSCKDKIECDNILSFMSSKLYVWYMMKGNNTNGWNDQIRRLPFLDTTTKWTDQKIYNTFSLTGDEINYIESNY